MRAGRVSVNDNRVQPGDKADASRDDIRVDGQRISLPKEFVYYAVYKPRGVLSTTAGPDPRPKVTDMVPGGEHLHIVGRLDKDSEGLMLLTNDGELTQHVTHPKYEQEKEYRVLVAKRPDTKQLEAWRRGVVMPEIGRSEPAEVRVEATKGKGAWLRVIMREGKKREIREIARTLGLPVVTLIRIRIASLRVGGLKAGQWRKLDETEVESLKSGVKPVAKAHNKR
jgi:23S rRNA pseudouridine2605 synthase